MEQAPRLPGGMVKKVFPNCPPKIVMVILYVFSHTGYGLEAQYVFFFYQKCAFFKEGNRHLKVLVDS